MIKLLILLIFISFPALSDVGQFSIPRLDPIKVMIVDTGIDPHPKLRAFVQYKDSADYKDNHGHGTHIAGLVAAGQLLRTPVCSTVQIYSCKYFESKSMWPQDTLRNLINCIKRATSEKMDIINYSGGGTSYDFEEYLALKSFPGLVIVAAGNESANLEKIGYYPASYAFGFKFKGDDGKFKIAAPLKNVIPVQATDSQGAITKSSNYHPKAISELGKDVYSTLPNASFGAMSGTSQATALYTHSVLMQRCKNLKNKIPVQKK